MGAACCVAAKSRTITNGPVCEPFQRHARYSPSWSFRRENRGRVAGEDPSVNWVDNVGNGDRVNFKSGTPVGTAIAFEDGSPMETFRTSVQQKSLVSEGNSENLKLPTFVSADQAVTLNLVEAKKSIEFPSASCPSPAKHSPAPSVSSLSTSPLSSQSHSVQPTSISSRLHHSPVHHLQHQLSDSQTPLSEEAFSFIPPPRDNESTGGSDGGSSDGWAIPAFSEFTAPRKERWSFDSDASEFSRDKSARAIGHWGHPPCDLHTCGVCMKLLTERSSSRWGSHVPANELAVVSVLICGHVYHAECLENLTPELNKYDPDCPVCIFGEKRVMKMSGKALKAELDSKAKKRLKKLLVDHKSKLVFDRRKSSPVLNSSLSMKSSNGKPFFRRHFSFGFKTYKPMSEDLSTRRKAFSWGRSSKD